MIRYFYVFFICGSLFFSGCAPQLISKKEAYPDMYNKPPTSLLVLPPINQTTAADAKEYYATTIAQPLSYKGYYVFPIEVVSEVLKQEGIYETELLLNTPTSLFKEHFGADAVMFILINQWDTNYYVIGGNVTVGIGYILKDTETGDVIWQFSDKVVVDTTGQNHAGGLVGLIAAAVETAVKTAMQDYVPVAQRVNLIALNCMPYGKYHPLCGQDGAQQVVPVKVKQE